MFGSRRAGAVCALAVFGIASMSLFTPRAEAQAVAIAQVAGRVTDPSGAPVAGAQVRIVETGKQQVHTTASDDQGRYTFPNLPIGSYRLEVQASGFKLYSQSGILLQVGNNVEINATLAVGSVNESIEVTASAEMVETRETSISQVIDQRRIVDLPLNGRQPTQLIVLSGAAVTAPGGGMTGSKNYASSTTISVAGGQANGVNYLLDGGDHNDSATNINLPVPFPDALQEFSVQTSSLPARYGLHPGAVVNAVTKSGTNSMHGDLFEFLRNGDVNARNTFAPRHDTLKRNQFGGTFGDRIVRDKLFFFGGFQATRQRTDPPQTVAYVPTAAVLNGDFSAIDSGSCVSGGKGIQLVDPTTKTKFAGNQIPVSRFNPQALNLLKYVPVSSNPCGKITYGIPSTGDENQGIGRIDWVQSARHSRLWALFHCRLPESSRLRWGEPADDYRRRKRRESAIDDARRHFLFQPNCDQFLPCHIFASQDQPWTGAKCNQSVRHWCKRQHTRREFSTSNRKQLFQRGMRHLCTGILQWEYFPVC